MTADMECYKVYWCWGPTYGSEDVASDIMDRSGLC